MILHLVHDEKIINRTISIFEEVAPEQNLFVVFTRHQLKHVTPQSNVILFQDFEKKYKSKDFSFVIVHFLNSRKMRFINKYLDKNLPVYWIIWGNDTYNKMLYPRGFELYDKESSYYKNIKKSFIGNFFNKIFNHFKTKRIENFILKRIDYIVTETTENDYDILIEYYPKLKIKPWREFFYYPIEIILGDTLMQKHAEGNNIQIGNSASITNNHEYAMRFLSKLNLGERKVIVPISYSGNEEYKTTVKTKGKEYFGVNFMALEKFLPLQEYNQLMLSTNVAIYGNFRQEAVGNILISLYLGAKVFIPKTNPIYSWAQNLGLTIYELEKISQKDIDEPLDDALRENNRNILKKMYNKERLKNLIEKSFLNTTYTH